MLFSITRINYSSRLHFLGFLTLVVLCAVGMVVYLLVSGKHRRERERADEELGAAEEEIVEGREGTGTVANDWTDGERMPLLKQ